MDSIDVRWALNPIVLWFHFDTVLAAEGIYQHHWGVQGVKAPKDYWDLLTREGQAVVDRLCSSIKLSLRKEFCVRRDYFSLTVPHERHWRTVLPLTISCIREAKDQPALPVKPITSWCGDNMGEPPQWLRNLLQQVA